MPQRLVRLPMSPRVGHRRAGAPVFPLAKAFGLAVFPPAAAPAGTPRTPPVPQPGGRYFLIWIERLSNCRMGTQEAMVTSVREDASGGVYDPSTKSLGNAVGWSAEVTSSGLPPDANTLVEHHPGRSRCGWAAFAARLAVGPGGRPLPCRHPDRVRWAQGGREECTEHPRTCGHPGSASPLHRPGRRCRSRARGDAGGACPGGRRSRGSDRPSA